MAGPITYDEFARYVRQFKTQKLLRMLALVGRAQWLYPGKLTDLSDPIAPHAASLVALEAMGGWGRRNQLVPTWEDIRYLYSLVVGLQEPYADRPEGSGPEDYGSIDDYLLRLAFQQFPYQQPPLNETARIRLMFSRSYNEPKFKVLSGSLITELLGVDVDTYVDFSPVFLAAVMHNKGTFDPGWFDLPNFKELADLIPPEKAIAIFERMTATPQDLKGAAQRGRNDDLRLRQYDFNMFAARPFVLLEDGSGIAPQPFFVTSRFAPSALYYAGATLFAGDAKMKNDFKKDLGTINEDYVLQQLGQLESIGLHVAGEVEYETGKKSIDVTVVLPDRILLFEVKSTRPILSARHDVGSYVRHLRRDIGHAITDQLNVTHKLWMEQHPALGHLPQGRPVSAFVVVPEPLYKANEIVIRDELPDAPFEVAVLSFTQLEQLIGAALHEGNGRVFIEAAHPKPPAMSADVRGALDAVAKRTDGTIGSNPIINESFDRMRWKDGLEKPGDADGA